MAVEMAIWRMTDSGPQKLPSSPLDSEQRLEDMLAQDPSMCGSDLLILGRQVQTSHGGYVDLLAIDTDGRVHVLELKRDRTPRDVVAQALDYGSWVEGLSLDDLERIFLHHHAGEERLDEAFANQFDSPLPDVVNAEQQFTIIASELDTTSDRIVEFLAESYGVPINAVFFRHFSDGDSEYLARTWLLDPQQAEARTGRSVHSKSRPWNGQDFYVALGRSGQGDERWVIAREYGFLNAGGGRRYWKPLQNLKRGHRVFAYVPGEGYVGIGEVVGEMMLARDAKVEVAGEHRSLLEVPEASPRMKEEMRSADLDLAMRVVQVDWIGGPLPIEEAVREKGLFSSQNTVCKLLDDRTIATVEAAFGIDEASL